jgi:hypothetical protein
MMTRCATVPYPQGRYVSRARYQGSEQDVEAGL